MWAQLEWDDDSHLDLPIAEINRGSDIDVIVNGDVIATTVAEISKKDESDIVH